MSICRSCGKEIVWGVREFEGGERPHPFDAIQIGDDKFKAGRSHFDTCAYAETHKRGWKCMVCEVYEGKSIIDVNIDWFTFCKTHRTYKDGMLKLPSGDTVIVNRKWFYQWQLRARRDARKAEKDKAKYKHISKTHGSVFG